MYSRLSDYKKNLKESTFSIIHRRNVKQNVEANLLYL